MSPKMTAFGPVHGGEARPEPNSLHAARIGIIGIDDERIMSRVGHLRAVVGRQYDWIAAMIFSSGTWVVPHGDGRQRTFIRL